MLLRDTDVLQKSIPTCLTERYNGEMDNSLTYERRSSSVKALSNYLPHCSWGMGTNKARLVGVLHPAEYIVVASNSAHIEVNNVNMG